MKLPAKVTSAMGEIASKFVMSHGLMGAFKALFYDNTSDDTQPSEGIEAIEQFLRGNTQNPWCLIDANDDDDYDGY